jgi:hypothetical protein
MTLEKQPEIKAVEVVAELRQIKTMVDGTFNVTLNLPEYCIEQVKIMLDWLKEEVKIVVIQP